APPRPGGCNPGPGATRVRPFLFAATGYRVRGAWPSNMLGSAAAASSHFPRRVGDEPRTAALFHGVAAGCVALQRACEYAVQDGGDPEHIEDEVDFPARDRRASRPPAIHRDVFLFGGDAERWEVESLQASELLRSEPPRHHLI